MKSSYIRAIHLVGLNVSIDDDGNEDDDSDGYDDVHNDNDGNDNTHWL